MTAADLAAAVAAARLHDPAGTAAQARLHDVTHDHRAAGPGVLYACRPGTRADGHDFAPAAVAAGTPALLVERVLDAAVPQIVVPRVAEVLGAFAAAVHAHPAERLLLLGVTGTNGKTTTAYLLEAALRACGHRTGLVGTVQTLVAGSVIPGLHTTPESTDLQRLLARMVDAGVTAVAMEVSSHGLALGRMAGARVDVAAFTNLTMDHLDFHRDLDDYFAAKARLFQPALAQRGVVNIDDGWGRIMAERAGVDVLTVSAAGGAADVTATDVVTGPGGSTFVALIAGRRVPVRTRLAGDFNVDNALLALAVAHVAGCDPEAAAEGIAALPGVPGRMERVDAGQPFELLVDYAHTPDSLRRVLAAARDLADGRVLVVFGCGGDRDRGKRPLMGRAAAELADLAVVTSDNPRSEDPQAIMDAVMAGARTVEGARVVAELDRRAAIAAAVARAGPGDVLVIAGRGHEHRQELAGGPVPFDDRQVAREALAARGFGEAAAGSDRAGGGAATG